MRKIKPWKIAIKDENYGVRGHKLFAILSYVAMSNYGSDTSFTELNRFSYNYTRRCKKNKLYTGRKYDKKRDRGYIGTNLYNKGYIGLYLSKKSRFGGYYLNEFGNKKLLELEKKFGVCLIIKYLDLARY